MARSNLGGGVGDFTFGVFNFAGKQLLDLEPATLTMWSAATGGTQYTDLLLASNPVTSIPVGPDGQIPVFQGPDGVTSVWADAGSTRVQMLALTDIATQVAAHAADVLGVVATTDGVMATAINTDGSLTDVALSAAIEAGVDPVRQADNETRAQVAGGMPRIVTLWGGHDDETPIVTNCTASVDTTNFKVGDRGTKLTMAGAVTATASLDPIGTTDPLVLGPTSVIGMWIYVSDVTKIDSVSIDLFTDSGLETLWASGDYILRLVNGWNFVRTWVGKAHGGGHALPANWGTFYRVRVIISSTAATDLTIGQIWAECPEKAQIMFILDGVFESAYTTEIYPALKARGIPVTFAQDTSQTGVGLIMSLAQLQEAANDGNNNSIGFHGHDGTTDSSKTAAQLRADTMKAVKWLGKYGFTGGLWRAAFFGNSAAQHAAIRGLVTAYACPAGASLIATWPFIDRWNVPRIGIHGWSNAVVDGMWSELAATNGLMVCYAHRVNAGGGADATPAEWAYFLTKLDAMIAAGTIEGVTYEQLFARAGGRFRQGMAGGRTAEYYDESGTLIRKPLP